MNKQGQKDAAVRGTPRVAVVSHRFGTFGGIQTCVSEIIAGLNERDIVPEIVWDTPPSPDFAAETGLRFFFKPCRFPISSKALAKLPAVLRTRFTPLQMRFARIDLNCTDFVYSFAPGFRIPPGVPNVCYTVGPPYISMPDEEFGLTVIESWGRFRAALHRFTTPRTRLDPHCRYVTLSNWIARRFRSQHGRDLPVIWPPSRSRERRQILQVNRRSGFLFLSRILEYKRPGLMIDLAERFPLCPVTIAGASAPGNLHVAELRQDAISRGVENLKFVENPSEEVVIDLLGRHEFFVFPAKWEHFGIVTVEAIEGGLIPLVHDSGGQREIVPFPELRFSSRVDLLDRAGFVQAERERLQSELMPKLREIATRGSAETFRAEMLRYLEVNCRGRNSGTQLFGARSWHSERMG